MIAGILAIKLAAHRAAQAAAKNVADDVYRHKAVMHRERLDWLEKAGYGRFVMASDSHVMPHSDGMRESEDGESKTFWALYSLKELQDAAEAWDLDTFEVLPETPENRKCECGGYIDSPCSHLGRPDRCQDCGAEYTSCALADLHGAIASLCGFGGATNCAAGGWFWSSPSVTVVRDRVLVTQWGAYDV